MFLKNVKLYTSLSLDVITLNLDHEFEMEMTYSILSKNNATFRKYLSLILYRLM